MILWDGHYYYSPFKRGGSTSSGSLTDKLKITQLLRQEASTQTQAIEFQTLTLYLTIQAV